MKPLSLELWMGVQLIIDLLFVILLFVFVRRFNREGGSDSEMLQQNYEAEKLRDAANVELEKSALASQNIMDELEPLVRGAQEAATSFDTQIKEKKRLIKGLNDTLDSRIISINLLLSRAEVFLKSQSPQSFNGIFSFENILGDQRPRENYETQGYNKRPDVFDQQKNIIEWYSKGIDAETIASRLSMPRGEVDLVINLKKKFIKMEKQR